MGGREGGGEVLRGDKYNKYMSVRYVRSYHGLGLMIPILRGGVLNPKKDKKKRYLRCICSYLTPYTRDYRVSTDTHIHTQNFSYSNLNILFLYTIVLCIFLDYKGAV